jgi:hypothetical protein
MFSLLNRLRLKRIISEKFIKFLSELEDKKINISNIIQYKKQLETYKKSILKNKEVA